MTDETAASILQYWFGSERDDRAIAAAQSKLWWSKNELVDTQIRERFESVLLRAAEGRCDDWRSTPHTWLALIVLFDQMPRNMYRGLARSFAFDAQARRVVVDGLASGFDAPLRPIERVFCYLPLEHSEALEDQERSVACYQQLLADSGDDLREQLTGYLDFARRHRDIIAQFGRFPHRNETLGRSSTQEELAFLQQPGSSF